MVADKFHLRARTINNLVTSKFYMIKSLVVTREPKGVIGAYTSLAFPFNNTASISSANFVYLSRKACLLLDILFYIIGMDLCS